MFDISIWFEVKDEARRAASKHPGSATILGTAPNGTNRLWKFFADSAREMCDRAEAAGRLTFANVLAEEVGEALCEEDDDKLRAELIQVAQVAVRWIANIDRRKVERDAPEQEAKACCPPGKGCPEKCPYLCATCAEKRKASREQTSCRNAEEPTDEGDVD